MGLELRGRQRRAVALIHLGEVDEGRLLLNEVNAAAYGGTLGPYDTVVLYCNAIGTCRDVAAFDEALAVDRARGALLRRARDLGVPGRLPDQPGGGDALRGQARGRGEGRHPRRPQLLATWAPRIAAAGYAEVGEVRLRLGDLAKAEEAFDQADELGHDPEPGRSLLLLAREKPDGRARVDPARARRRSASR